MDHIPNRFALFAFGDDNAVHSQAYLAILSLMAHAPADCEFVMVTDRPDNYHWFAGALTVLPVDASTLASWRGPHNFFWRMKMMAIRTAAGQDRVNLIYVDSDVVARRSLAPLCAALSQGSVFMHVQETVLAASRRRGQRILASRLANQTFSGFRITADTAMWNAGVVAVAAAHLHLLDDAIALCDALCAQVTDILLEQLSYSVALASTGALGPADGWIDHYWGNKRGYLESGNALLSAILIQQRSVEQAVALIRDHPINRPVSVRRRWWNRYFLPLAGGSF
jgi:hypothetical protein